MSKQFVRDILSGFGVNDFWINKGKKHPAPKRSRGPKRRLGFESLEGRALLSVSPGTIIQGIAFNDVLHNDLPAGQPVLQGATVNLFKDGGNAAFDGGIGIGADDTPVGAPVLTDAAGHYAFSVDAAGTYFVQEIAPAGFTAPGPITVPVSAADLDGVAQTTIDSFTTSQTVIATPAVPDGASSVAAPEAIGLHRDLSVHITSASGELLFEANPAFDPVGTHLLHFDTLGNSGTGTYIVAWDGANPNTPPTLDFTGLGGVNLASGGATGISLSLGADHDNSTATFNIYKDATNFSTVTVDVPGPSAGISILEPNQTVFIPFSSFSLGGGTGAGDFSDIGAIQLQIAGGIAGLNGQIAFVQTFAPSQKTANLPNTANADLSITKNDDQTTVVSGTTDIYTIVVTNAGPSAVTGANVVDNFPAAFTGVTYTAAPTGGATGFTATGSGNINDTVNMPVGSTITYTVTGTIDPTATGQLINTATVTPPDNITDPSLQNNTATDTDTIQPQADLSIVKSDGKATVVPGTTNTYGIAVTNGGPSAVNGATVVDNFPVTFTGVTYTASSTGGATGFTAIGSGNINDTNVNMPVGSIVIYVVTGTVSPSATGNLTNTATVAAPQGVVETDTENNSATDTDSLTPEVDLSITKTDGKTTISGGATNTYTIVVSNAGPSDVTGASVADTFPAAFTGVAYTATQTGGATGFTTIGSGNINDSVNMPVGSTITYVVTGTVSPSATGTLANTATVNAPEGVTDTDTDNNTDTDTDTITPQADLSITKTDGKTTAVPGTTDTYTIVVTNGGPSDVTGASVVDTFPVTFTGVTYTATSTGGAIGFTISGSGNINDTSVNMPAGSTITYVVTGTISASATGNLVNTATVAVPQGDTDPTPGNDSATDTDTLTPQADLSISKTDGKTTVVPGTTDTYTIVVTNAGPSAVTGASVVDTFPVTFTGVTYTATTTGGATGFTTSGIGNINDTSVNMPVGSTITYVVTGTVSPSATGTLANTATVAVPQGVTDLTPSNNTATDTDTLTPQADLSISKTDGKTTVVPGTTDTYTIVVTNGGPSAVTGASVVDTFPVTFTGVTYTAATTGGRRVSRPAARATSTTPP